MIAAYLAIRVQNKRQLKKKRRKFTKQEKTFTSAACSGYNKEKELQKQKKLYKKHLADDAYTRLSKKAKKNTAAAN